MSKRVRGRISQIMGADGKNALYEIFSDEEYLRLLNENLISRARKDSGSLRVESATSRQNGIRVKHKAGASSQMFLPFLVTSKNGDLFTTILTNHHSRKFRCHDEVALCFELSKCVAYE